MSVRWRIDVGDCRERLGDLEASSVHTCVTSPPYFGLRDYGTASWEGGDPNCEHTEVEGARRTPWANQVPGPAGKSGKNASFRNETKETGGRCTGCGAERVDRQIGHEPTPDEFVEATVSVFREVRRVLADDGTLWLNLGDSYAGSWGAQGKRVSPGEISRNQIRNHPKRPSRTGTIAAGSGLKPKDLMGIPWMVAFALRADGWYLRSEVIWHKPNPMPESITDRPTKSHEQIFLLSKSLRYYYDAEAIRERDSGLPAGNGFAGRQGGSRQTTIDDGKGTEETWEPGRGRNKRTVWTVPTKPYTGAHFATFPPDLIEPCVLAGAPEGGVVLDPFAGAGTTGLVALRHGRSFVGIELNPAYAEIARHRIRDDAPLLNAPAEEVADRRAA